MRALLVGVLLYSMSTPFPVRVGVVEMLVALLLFIGLISGILNVIFFRKVVTSSIFYLLFFFPLIVGLINGNYLTDVVRDVIPLFYMMIPAFLFGGGALGLRYYLEKFPYVLAVVGVIFACRELLLWYFSGGLGVGVIMSTDDYIIQSPLVLFAGVFLFCRAILSFYQYKYFAAIVFFAFGVLPFLGFYYAVLRAPLGLMVLIPVVYAFLLYGRNLIKLFIFLFLLLPVILFLLTDLDVGYYLSMFIEKQEKYGDNNKLAEIREVWRLISEGGFLKFAFGNGWGGTWFSPAVGAEVRYAHSLVTYSILKGGAAGLLFFILSYLVFFLASVTAFLKVKKSPYMLLILLSIMPPIYVNVFLESAYKTLGFGLVSALLFCVLFCEVEDESRNSNLPL
jgi:hypothetical protein